MAQETWHSLDRWLFNRGTLTPAFWLSYLGTLVAVGTSIYMVLSFTMKLVEAGTLR